MSLSFADRKGAVPMSAEVKDAAADHVRDIVETHLDGILMNEKPPS